MQKLKEYQINIGNAPQMSLSSLLDALNYWLGINGDKAFASPQKAYATALAVSLREKLIKRLGKSMKDAVPVDISFTQFEAIFMANELVWECSPTDEGQLVLNHIEPQIIPNLGERRFFGSLIEENRQNLIE